MGTTNFRLCNYGKLHESHAVIVELRIVVVTVEDHAVTNLNEQLKEDGDVL